MLILQCWSIITVVKLLPCKTTSFVVNQPLSKRNLSLTAQLDGWTVRIRQLNEYKGEHGNCLVPKRFKENPSLGNWVNKQRQLYRKYQEGQLSSLTPARIQELNEMGFIWNASGVNSNLRTEGNGCDKGESITNVAATPSEVAWWRRFEELKQYHKHHGEDAVVPSSSSLGRWIIEQRKRVNPTNGKSKLAKQRIEALDSIKFSWKPRQQQVWEQRFQELLEYKQKFGDCIVPISYKKKPLARWVARQRRQYGLHAKGKLNQLTPERIKQLESVGFVWDRWEYEFAMKQVRIAKKELLRASSTESKEQAIRIVRMLEACWNVDKN